MVRKRESIEMATVRRIAEECGLSPATVSRVLNRYPYVRPEVRNRVMRAARKLGHVSEQRNYAVVLPAAPFFSSYTGMMLTTILRGFAAHGCHAEIIEQSAIHLLAEYALSGAISMMNDNGFEKEWAALQRLPLVCLNTRPRHIDNIYTVLADDRQGIFLALDYLKAHGHRRIAYLYFDIRPEERGNWNFRCRMAAYREWMYRNCTGIEPPVIDASCNRNWGSGQEIRTCTAVLAIGENAGLWAASDLLRAGRRIPEDISLMAFENPATSEFASPPQTTIAQDIGKMAECALNLLEKQIAGKGVSGDLLVEYTLQERDSVRQLI